MLVRMRCAAGTPCFLPAPHTFHASHTFSASSNLSAGHMQRMRCGGGKSCSLPVSPHFPYLPHFHPLSGRMHLTCCAASTLCPPPAPCLSHVFHTFPISPCSAEHMQLTCCAACTTCSPPVPSLPPTLDLLKPTLSMHLTLSPPHPVPPICRTHAADVLSILHAVPTPCPSHFPCIPHFVCRTHAADVLRSLHAVLNPCSLPVPRT